LKKLLAFLIAVFVSMQSLGASAQEKKETERDQQIRLKTELVQVRAVVTDKKGQPIGNLTKDDFEILEDNRPQQISFFSVHNLGSLADSKATAATTPASLRIPQKIIEQKKTCQRDARRYH
jgi:VWFA-related protein